MSVLNGFTEVQRAAFGAAQPFRHLIVDGALPEDLLSEALAAIPPADHAAWRRYRRNKFGLQSLADFPALLNVFQLLAAPEWVSHLETLTGIVGLRADPELEGGGVHRVMREGSLGVHVDFNVHPHRPAFVRRVNLLLYLNRDWQATWGGALELWDAERCRVQIEPAWNRMVLCEATEQSWHGHPQPLMCPPERCRLSLAAYYYTQTTDGNVTAHSTIYRKRA